MSKKYDLDLIKDAVSIEDVCDLFGIETKKMGKKLSVLCPFHNDQHHGSAFIKDNRIYCFPCGQYYSVLDIYMFFCNITIQEAAEQITADWGLSNATETMERIPFTKEELTLIGLYRSDRKQEFYPIRILPGYTRAKGFKQRKDKDGTYLLSLKGKSQILHLIDLYTEDRETFSVLVTCKAWEAFKKLKRFYLQLRNVERKFGRSRDEFLDSCMWYCISQMDQIQQIFQKAKAL